MKSRAMADAWPGVVGGLVALAAALILRTLIGTRLFAELSLDAMVDFLPGKDFSGLLGVFGPYGKALFFFSVLFAQLFLYVVVWLRFSEFADGKPEEALNVSIAAAFSTWALLMVASLVLVLGSRAGLAGTGWPAYAFSTAMTSALYAGVAGLQAFGPGRAGAVEEEGIDQSRRRFLARVPGLALGGLALIVIARVVRDTAGGGVQKSHRGQPTQEVTPNDEFYVVSKNLIDPQVDQGSWQLHVGGLVQSPLDLGYEGLTAFESQEQYTTMQCISNEVGGELMSNALWRGVPLKSLLARAGPRPEARVVLFRCADGYTETLPLDFAQHEAVIVAYQMNGQPLPRKHGFPLRLLSPGKYGMKHPKWLTDVMLLDAEAFGYWQQQGWSQEARMNTSVRIDVPGPSAEVPPGPYLIEGIAFSGDRGISKVEVSTDEQLTWQDAKLKPPLGPYTWVLWSFAWQAPAGKRGDARIWARATDGDGQLQTAESADPYPSGATGFHSVQVEITGSQSS